jgi:osmotically-inducible protein OsmY
MRTFPLRALVVLLAGCNPYVIAASGVSATYGVVMEERSVSTQLADAKIEALIRAGLMASRVSGTGSFDVFCRQGVVVLAGVASRGSHAAREAVQMARTTPGVRRVKTYFVTARSPSMMSDFELKVKIKAALISDPGLIAGRVDIGVHAGHVVLVGVVGSRETIKKFVDDARSVTGVVAVKSYIQVKT